MNAFMTLDYVYIETAKLLKVSNPSLFFVFSTTREDPDQAANQSSEIGRGNEDRCKGHTRQSRSRSVNR